MKRALALMSVTAVVTAVLTWSLLRWAETPNPSVRIPPQTQSARQPDVGLKGSARPAPASSPEIDTDSGLDEFLSLLDRGDYTAAVNGYDTLYRATPDERSLRPYRQAILKVAQALTANGAYRDARALLSAYTGLFHKDVEALYLLAYSQHSLGEYSAAIDSAYLALAEAVDAEHIKLLREQLVASVHEHAQQRREEHSPRAAIELYQAMLLREPDFGPFQWGLARAYVDAGLTDEALEALGRITDVTLLERARTMRDTIEQRLDQARRAATAIPLSRTGGGYTVGALINGRHRVVLLIDTGASMTSIRADVLALAGIGPGTRRQRFTTANGVLTAPVVRVDSLEVGGQTVRDLEVGSLSLPGLAVDGLLGMNFLDSFEFTIRQQERVLYLQR